METIGPKGKRVLYETAKGNFDLTNDGITIIRGIELEDPIEHAVVEIVKGGSLRTNAEAGDGTSTTILFSNVLIKKAIQLRDSGLSHTAIQQAFEMVGEKLIKRLNKLKHEVKNDKTQREIAFISSGGDSEIADNVVETVNTAGLTGMVYLELYANEKTMLEKQEGFRIGTGMMIQQLYDDVARPQMNYKEIPTLILDKTLYYADDAEHIIRTAVDLGYRSICLVAKDFAGDSLNTFVTNHVRGTIKIVLAKLDSDVSIDDLAVYLGGTIVSESSGRRIDSITRDDFVIAGSVTADPQKILFTNTGESKDLKKRVDWIRSELAKDKENKVYKERLASLTNGIVTLKVGGRTEQEARERVYRYEDSVNAVRAAMKDGYLVGGGLSMFNAFDRSDYSDEVELSIATLLSESSIRQIARNAEHKVETSKITKTHGYNARTDKYENLLESGVVEPFKATEMAIKNAVSVAVTLTSIGTFILNAPEDKDK